MKSPNIHRPLLLFILQVIIQPITPFRATPEPTIHAATRQLAHWRNSTPSPRANILSRSGDHFKLNRFSSRIEFGYTSNLITKIRGSSPESLSAWLSEETRVAGSIWEPSLVSSLPDGSYRLSVKPVQFVTLRLSPTVDVRMKTEQEEGGPVFRMESVGFDPNVEVLPGVVIDAKDLEIEIDVVGELRVGKEGLKGKIGFVSKGKLSPPLMLLPEVVLRKAAELISGEINNFAKESFRKGSQTEFAKFLRED